MFALAGVVLVLTVLETAPGENDGQVPVAMGICIAHSATQEGHRVVEQRLPAWFFDLLELAKKAGELGDVKSLDDGELGDRFLDLPMVRERVVTLGHSRQSSVLLAEICKGQRNDPRRIGLQGQGHQVVEEGRAFPQGQGIDLAGKGIVGFRFLTVEPELGLFDPALQFSDQR